MPHTKCIISMVGREIAGYHTYLHQGFDELGINNYFFYERPHPFYKHEKPRTRLERYITKINNIILSSRNHAIKMALIFLLYPFVVVLKLLLFPYFLKNYNIFIFGANYSYLGLYIDRLILKIFNKTIIDVTTGSDVRPPYLNGLNSLLSTRRLHIKTLIKKYRVGLKNYFSDFIIDHQSVSQFNRKNYVSFLYMGFARAITSRKKSTCLLDTNTKPIILHAPSNPSIKGTYVIREVIKELQKDHDFVYEELIDIPNHEVLNKIKKCSFVINQLYTDTLMSGLDVEAASMGKPSIVGGYNLDWVKSTIPDDNVPPTYTIYPDKDELKKAIIHLLTDATYCQALGSQAYEFVNNHWSCKAVAQKYIDMVEDRLPSHAWRSPADDINTSGLGLTQKNRNTMVHALVKNYGVKALCLEHNQSYKHKLLTDCHVHF